MQVAVWKLQGATESLHAQVVRFLLLLCSLIWQSHTAELGKETVTCTDLTNMEIAPRDRRTIGSIALFTRYRYCKSMQGHVELLSLQRTTAALRGSRDMHRPRVS